MNQNKNEYLIPLTDDEADSVTGGITSKRVEKGAKRKMSGRKFDVAKTANDTLVKVEAVEGKNA